jgi:hypothetical protein
MLNLRAASACMPNLPQLLKPLALPVVVAQPALGAPLFFPTKEVLSLLRGIKSKDADLKTIESIFDSTYLDLCEKLMVKKPIKAEEMIESDPRFGAVYEKLVNALEGRFSLTDLGGTVQMSFDPGQYQVQRDKRSAQAEYPYAGEIHPQQGRKCLC